MIEILSIISGIVTILVAIAVPFFVYMFFKTLNGHQASENEAIRRSALRMIDDDRRKRGYKDD